ncbi:hypothetical protein ABEF95_003052 [Exophiala dermatitidis]
MSEFFDIEDVGGAESCYSAESAAFHLDCASNEDNGLVEYLLPTEGGQIDAAGLLECTAGIDPTLTQGEIELYGNPATAVHGDRSETVSSRVQFPQEQPFALDSVFDGSSKDKRLLTPDVKCLLRNYAENVLPIFGHVGFMDTPWARLHLPRALQCITELEVLGRSPESRQALLYTALCVSAYNQYNTCSSEAQDVQDHKWLDIAASYKGRALQALETSLRESTLDFAKSDFGEILGAMLAMVTIGIISGDMGTCELHLQACESLIQDRLLRRGEENFDIIRGLFTVFLYVRTIQEATKLYCEQSPEISPPGSQQANKISLDELVDLFTPQKGQPKFSWWSCELIYGFPPSLLLLLKRATGLLQATCQHNGDHPGGFLNDSVEAALNKLEDEVLHWPVDDIVNDLGNAPVSPEKILIMQHSTRVFHQALILFCCRKIRNVHPKVVEPHVRSLIFRLEQIETFKEKAGIRTGHMLWPAFVAGSQTTVPDLQARFLRWFAMVNKAGQRSSNISKEVLVDIWRCNSNNLQRSVLSTVQLVLT